MRGKRPFGDAARGIRRAGRQTGEESARQHSAADGAPRYSPQPGAPAILGDWHGWATMGRTSLYGVKWSFTSPWKPNFACPMLLCAIACVMPKPAANAVTQ